MFSTAKKNVRWKWLQSEDTKHLNLVDKSSVNQAFFDNVDYLGVCPMNTLSYMYDEMEWRSIEWGMKQAKIPEEETAFLMRVKIRHHLRRGKQNDYHHETWLFAMVKNQDDIYYVCPLKRDSDFNFDIFEDIAARCHADDRAFPWQRFSCQR